jgi:NADPH:quinone reductase-like Zn-dependent oxidoreductase
MTRAAGERVDVDTNRHTTPADGLRHVTRAALTPLATLTTAHAESPVRSVAARQADRKAVAFTGLRSLAAKRRDLLAITDLVAAGTLRPVIDTCYPLAGIADAHAA